MKERWLNFILLLTNRIYAKKHKLLGGVGIRIFVDIFGLILLELFLTVLSLPLYLGMKTSGVLAFFGDNGGYEKIKTDYKVRRILTLSGVGVIFVIWFIKLLFIVLPPVVYGPLQLYSVSDLEPIEIDRQELITQDTRIQTAEIVSSLGVPKIEAIERDSSDKYLIYGTGTPGQTAVIFLVEDKTLMYSVEIDSGGKWRAEHLQTDYKLKEGIHSVFAFVYDSETGTRSHSSAKQYFRIRDSGLESIFENMDLAINWAVIIFVSIGLFLTFLTI